jgi:hypothetical protein
MEDIKGLDEEVCDVVYLKHPCLNDLLELEITQDFYKGKPVSEFISGVIDSDRGVLNNDSSPIAISRVSTYSQYPKNITMEEEADAFKMVFAYLQLYANNKNGEYMGIKKPATESNVKLWLENADEASLFGEYRQINKDQQEGRPLLRKLSIVISLANYMGMVELVNKCCYLIAYAIAGKTPEQIEILLHE